MTNRALGSSVLQRQKIVLTGAIPKLVNLFRSDSANVAEQAVWALGSIVGDGAFALEDIFNCHAVEALLEILSIKTVQPTFLRRIVWLMSKLCRDKNQYALADKIKMMLPALATFLRLDDDQILGKSKQPFLSLQVWGFHLVSRSHLHS